jgi:hypothetical protein
VTPFGRTLREGAQGSDVLGVKRALARAGYPKKQKLSELTPVFGPYAVIHLDQFRQAHGLRANHLYDRPAHLKLSPFFDATAEKLYVSYDPALDEARRMVEFCKQFDGPYVYGGEHDLSFADDDPDDGFDCSSSTSYLLHSFDLLGSSYAHTSSWFETWALRGRGKYVTVHANADHVWVSFALPEGWCRFDTSPHGCGERGPRLRFCSRPEFGFTVRHPAGL